MNRELTTNLGRRRLSARSLLPVLNIRPTPISDQHITRCTAQHHGGLNIKRPKMAELRFKEINGRKD